MAYRPLKSYNLTITAANTAVAGPPVSQGVTKVRLVATALVYTDFNKAATVGTSMMLSAGQQAEEYLIGPGQVVSVVSPSASGIVNVTEMSA